MRLALLCIVAWCAVVVSATTHPEDPPRYASNACRAWYRGIKALRAGDSKGVAELFSPALSVINNRQASPAFPGHSVEFWDMIFSKIDYSGTHITNCIADPEAPRAASIATLFKAVNKETGEIINSEVRDYIFCDSRMRVRSIDRSIDNAVNTLWKKWTGIPDCHAWIHRTDAAIFSGNVTASAEIWNGARAFMNGVEVPGYPYTEAFWQQWFDHNTYSNQRKLEIIDSADSTDGHCRWVMACDITTFKGTHYVEAYHDALLEGDRVVEFHMIADPGAYDFGKQ